jgi:SAM-dependent methyltransferase
MKEYVSSFGYEWSRHSRTQFGDESDETFHVKTGWTPADIQGRRVLDAGCGSGRFADVVRRWGGNVTAFDLSGAVQTAAPAGRVAKADLFAPPFPPRTFDKVYCLGVLHHTPWPGLGVYELSRLVKPGGELAIWVYGEMGSWARRADRLRRWTPKLPHRLLYALCHAAVLTRGFGGLMPVSTHPRWRWRVLDTFDWYAPPIQSRHDLQEVSRWLWAADLRDLVPGDFPVSMRGRRPLRG